MRAYGHEVEGIAVHRVLIVANQTIGSAELTSAINERIASGSRFHLLVPVPPTPPSAISVGLAAVVGVVERDQVDEIIVSTLPSRISKWLRQDLPHKIEKHVTVPVTVVSASTSAASDPA